MNIKFKAIKDEINLKKSNLKLYIKEKINENIMSILIITILIIIFFEGKRKILRHNTKITITSVFRILNASE